MDPGNSFYGHRRILADYAGMEKVPPIWGHLQHGWTPDHPFVDRRVYPGLRKYVWSQANLAAARDAGIRSVVPIGAPFLYLAARRPPVSPVPGSVIVYPFHGWEQAGVVGNHDALISEIKAEYGSDVTVCLYWVEHDDPTVRAAYEAAGFRVITHGHRDSNPDFLRNQLAELERHETVVSNRVSTALWYGGYLQRHMRVFGTVFALSTIDNRDAFARMQRERWPAVCGGGVGGDEAYGLAAVELGAQFVVDPDTLRAALGWTGWRRLAAPALDLTARARRRVTTA